LALYNVIAREALAARLGFLPFWSAFAGARSSWREVRREPFLLKNI